HTRGSLPAHPSPAREAHGRRRCTRIRVVVGEQRRGNDDRALGEAASATPCVVHCTGPGDWHGARRLRDATGTDGPERVSFTHHSTPESEPEFRAEHLTLRVTERL